MNRPVDENKMNKKMEDLLNQQIDTAKSDGEDVKEIPNKNPNNGTSKCSMFNGKMMDFTTIMEALQLIESCVDCEESEIDQPIDTTTGYDEKEVMEELNKLFTPVLVMQNYENDIADNAVAELESAKVLTERTIIKFDDDTRMAQLIAICAKLIAKNKNTKSWQLFKQASSLKKKASLDLQKEEYNTAKILAQKYLVKVSSENPSSVARQAALELLPKTTN